jgi:DNA-directed RNA polymerase specialized sigma24 family protein
MRAWRRCRDVTDYSDLFRALRPRLEAVLRRYEIPGRDAAELLEEAVMEWIYKAERSADPAAWLVTKLRDKCRRYWVARRHLVREAVARVFQR